jgi:hypothetical protein
MLLAPLVLAVAALQQQTPPAQAAPPSPIASIQVTPAHPVVASQDSVRLRAEAFDSAGRPMPGARIRFRPAGGYFEGSVDTLGLVRSGSTGVLPVAVIATLPGSRPAVTRVEVRMVAGPAARVEIAPSVRRLVVGQRVRLGGTVYSAEGDRRADTLRWTSSSPGVARVSASGMLVAAGAGRATVTAGAGAARATLELEVIPDAIASLGLVPATAEGRTGDVIRFTLAARDAQGRAITGLAPAFSLSPGAGMIDPDGAFVGYEARGYTVTAVIGGHVAEATVTLRHRDVRRPATVVGRLPRTRFTTEEVWVHPNGRNAYLGSGSGGDVMYALDVADPAHPTVTDSLVLNTRRVNDVMTTRDGRYLVMTREGASDRKNGIVIASLEDPAHPRVISEFTEGVTAGVHSAFVYTDPRHGTHVFLTNDGTGALHVLNLDDPAHPREVATWRTARSDAGRTLHDVDVRDGLAYLAYWNDGLVVLDVGNGMRGGTPSSPRLVSQYRYDLNDLYRGVEATGGPGFIRGTHTAWRDRDYVFIADEVFPASTVQGAKDASAGRAYGRLQVLDVSDPTRPRPVAWYEPEHGGVHNVWVQDGVLYMGAYNAGFRAFDVSGELRGDLRAQEREIAHVNTADLDGYVRNAAMTWGVVVANGLAYVNDMYNGLWIVRLEPQVSSGPPLGR